MVLELVNPQSLLDTLSLAYTHYKYYEFIIQKNILKLNIFFIFYPTIKLSYIFS